jgi:hypothetical protein
MLTVHHLPCHNIWRSTNTKGEAFASPCLMLLTLLLFPTGADASGQGHDAQQAEQYQPA